MHKKRLTIFYHPENITATIRHMNVLGKISNRIHISNNPKIEVSANTFIRITTQHQRK